ncbi:MAG: hypothetical protein H0X39_20190, partial [Actinobacteria bacterium]|nr:hypothetical protein [Actinomycetota bacterium]
MIEPVDLGVCQGYEYAGDPERTAVALPGAMLTGMPALWHAIEPLLADEWRVVLVWDQFLDRTQGRLGLDARPGRGGREVRGRGAPAKSLTTRAAGLAADHGWSAVWLMPLLAEPESLACLRRRTAPALLVGGTADASWDGSVARQLSGDVVEIDGADHGLARIDQAPLVAAAVAEFSG